MDTAECPFHDLPPEQTVTIRAGGMALPYSAERACSEWHLAQVVAPLFDRARDACDRWIADQQSRERSAALLADPQGHPLVKPRPQRPRTGRPA